MLDFYDAHTQILAKLNTPTKNETVPLLQAHNCILATDLLVQIDAPLFDNSAMDGFAICDATGKLTEFTVVSRIAAGDDAETLVLKDGEAARIFTGAPVPKGATAIVAQEDTQLQNETSLILNIAPKPKQHIRYLGEELKAGNQLLPKGTKLLPAHLGLIASQGLSQVPIYKKLTAIVFSTGNELVNPEKLLATGKIYDANRYQLLSWLTHMGIIVQDGGILADDPTLIQTVLKQASQQFDVIITSGGASVGDADYLKSTVQNLGELIAYKLAIKPGKPFAWGTVGSAHVFMLPGNPVATFVTCHLLLQSALKKLMGDLKTDAPYFYAQANFNQTKTNERREFLRATLSGDGETNQTWVNILSNQGSGMLSACAEADVLVEVPPRSTVTQGQNVKVYPLI